MFLTQREVDTSSLSIVSPDITPLFDIQTLSLNAETTAEYVIVDSVDVRNSMDPCPDTQSLNKMVEDNTPETSNEQKYTTDKVTPFILY